MCENESITTAHRKRSIGTGGVLPVQSDGFVVELPKLRDNVVEQFHGFPSGRMHVRVQQKLTLVRREVSSVVKGDTKRAPPATYVHAQVHTHAHNHLGEANHSTTPVAGARIYF